MQWNPHLNGQNSSQHNCSLLLPLYQWFLETNHKFFLVLFWLHFIIEDLFTKCHTTSISNSSFCLKSQALKKIKWPTKVNWFFLTLRLNSKSILLLRFFFPAFYYYGNNSLKLLTLYCSPISLKLGNVLWFSNISSCVFFFFQVRYFISFF